MAYTVACDGDIGIRRVSEIQSEIVKAFEAHTSLLVDISAGARPDVSFIQLIESARVQAGLEGKSIALAAPATGPLFDVLTRSGFLSADRPRDAAFWLHESDAR